LKTQLADFFAIFTVAVVAAVLAAYSFRTIRAGRIASPRLDGVRGTRLLGRFPIEAFHWAAIGVARTLTKSRIEPDTLTMTSLGLTVLTVPLAAAGHLEAAGAVLLAGSVFDMLDGIVARERGMACDAGEMLDSVADRYADGACLIGLGIFYRESAWRLGLVFVTLMGSMMVSYVRAKAEKFRLSLPSTWMRRPERITYLAGALILGPSVSRWVAPSEAGEPATFAILALVAVVSNLAACKLLVAARKELRRAKTV